MLISVKALAMKEQQQAQPKVDKVCPVCSNNFTVRPSGKTRIYCSKACYCTDSTQQYRKAAPGGYRPGSGRSKSGYYKEIYCGSTYELCWVIYSLDHGIEFTRFPGLLAHNGVKYYPDFLLADGKTVIETKGYEKQDSVDVKTAVAEHHGYTLKVLRAIDLQPAFDYVAQQYGTKEYHTLYDDYKPLYNYVCGHCEKEYSRDKKVKTEAKFCSRACCGKARVVARRK